MLLEQCPGLVTLDEVDLKDFPADTFSTRADDEQNIEGAVELANQPTGTATEYVSEKGGLPPIYVPT